MTQTPDLSYHVTTRGPKANSFPAAVANTVTVTADDATFVMPGGQGTVFIDSTSTGVDLTLDNPSTDDNGKEIVFLFLVTTNASTVVADLNKTTNLRTFTLPAGSGAGEIGDSLVLRAHDGYWICTGCSPNVTLT